AHYDRPMRIRAAVLEQFGVPLEVQELELADPKAGEALVRLVACGVCHTDLYTASGADPSGYAPTVLGHEGAGIVERVGKEASSASARWRAAACRVPSGSSRSTSRRNGSSWPAARARRTCSPAARTRCSRCST